MSAGDPLHFRPRPGDLVSKVPVDKGEGSSDEDGSHGDEEGEETVERQVYVPPKIVAVPYSEDKGRSPKLKHKKGRDSVLQELKDELSDAPVELQVCELHVPS